MNDFAKEWGFTAHQSNEGLNFSCQSPDGRVRVTGTAQRTERGLVISSMEWGTEHPTGIIGQTCRDFPIVDLIAALRMATVPQPREEPDGVPKPLTDEHLRQVALAYIVETGPGKPRGAARRLAERFGRPEGTVFRWIALAREGGWLEPTWQGRRGAEPGPRLRDGESV